MISRFSRLFQKKGPGGSGGTALGWSLVTAVVCALAYVGSLVWIDNREAVIPDFNPATVVQLTLFKGVDGHESDYCQLENMDNDGIPLKSQLLVRGNGDQDDNRERPLIFQRAEVEMVSLAWIPAVTSFADRRTVAAYWVYGHLRVMPVGDIIYCAEVGFV